MRIGGHLEGCMLQRDMLYACHLIPVRPLLHLHPLLLLLDCSESSPAHAHPSSSSNLDREQCPLTEDARREHDAAAGAGRFGAGRAGAAAVGGGGDQLHGGRREGVEPQGGLHRLGQEAQALLQGRLAPVPVPERSVRRGAGGRGRLRQLQQGERHHQPQQGHQLRLPAQGGQGLLLHLQLRLLLLRHEARRHRQEGFRLLLLLLFIVLV